ncbi:MAG: alcohol dehydrogenase catalytic domain-containing protein [Kiritimatiellaeota bacterium]|nr:alcohol dehydrogenase catalytic domain-containing protein [Kiritimatiellota bacterium]
MKVSRWYNNADIRLEEVPTPKPGPNEMLVKVLACGICGSDIVEWYRLPRAPLVQGHEIGAKVVETGSGVTKFTVGERVFIAPKVACLQCEDCRRGHHPICSKVKDRLPGGFAEYILVPEALVEKGTYRLPDRMTYEQSTFIEPLACVIRAQRLAGVTQDQSVLILGCGMTGLLHIKLAKTKNCTIAATDVNDKRLALAKSFGAGIILKATDAVADRLVAENGKKADIVIVCTSALPAIEQAWKCVAKGGAVVFFAVPAPGKQVTLPINEFWTQEIRILTSYYCGPDDLAAAMELLASGAVVIEDLITHRLPLAETAKGFQLVLDGQASIKVIIHPNPVEP